MASEVLYNIFYKNSDESYALRIHYLGLNTAELNRFITAYCKALPSIFLRGDTVKFSIIRGLKIYDNSRMIPPRNEREDIEDFFEKTDGSILSPFGTHYESIFRKMGRDVTEKFILGEWGYLKDSREASILNQGNLTQVAMNAVLKPYGDRYHIYIKSQGDVIKPQYHTCVPKSEAVRLKEAYSSGQSRLTINGKVTIIEHIEKIKVYQVSGDNVKVSTDELQNRMRSRAHKQTKRLLNERILKEFGTDVTPEFIQGNFGEHSDVIQSAVKNKASTFRLQLGTIKNQRTKDFVEEAISCYSNSNYRAAVVLSWVGAISLLYDHVIEQHLVLFNAEATRINPKWKNATTIDDLTNMKEYTFIQIISSVGVIGKNLRQELEHCLQLRNSCGHPNTLVVGELRAAGHIETLILNVFTKF